VLEAGFFWSQGDRSGAGGTRRVPILSNCDHLKIYWAGDLKQELEPDRQTYAHLKYPPFMMDLGDLPLNPWGDLKIEGYLRGKLAKTLLLSGSGKDVDLKVIADDRELTGDGRDATRVVLMVTDEYGNMRPFTTAAVSLSCTGPGEIIGENPLVLVGGAAAVWVRAKEAAGVVRLTAAHTGLGSRSVSIRVKAAEPEMV
jgi:beta-galactosidase